MDPSLSKTPTRSESGRAGDPAREPAAETSGDAFADLRSSVDALDTHFDPAGTAFETPRPRGRGHLESVASDQEIYRLGRRAFAQQDDAAAREHLMRLVRHGVRYADVHYMLGLVAERAGEYDEAVSQLREATRLNPSYVEALLALASLHETRGDFDRARGYAERASQLARPAAGELDPTTRGKLANQQAELGDALAAAGELRDAIAQYRGALERCPTFHDIRHRLATTLREAGLPAQAADEFQRILRRQPAMLESQIQLALTYYSLGRTPEAIRLWDAVLEKDPSRDDARMYLRMVRGAEARSESAEAGGWKTTDLQAGTRDGSGDEA